MAGAVARTEDEEGGEVESVMGLTMSDEDVEEGYITAVDDGDDDDDDGGGGESCCGGTYVTMSSAASGAGEGGMGRRARPIAG